MKARVKATGEIVEIVGEGIQNSNMVMAAHGEWFTKDELDIVPLSWKPFKPTYWQKLEHQAAIGAMQAMLTSPELMQVVTSAKELLTNDFAKRVAVVAARYAHALVEELKEKEEMK